MKEQTQNKYLRVIIAVLVGLLLIVGGVLIWNNFKTASIKDFNSCQDAGYPIRESYPAVCALPNGKAFTQDISGDGVACTMEARLCPDGSSVGRSGPNCEFAACPVE